MPDIRRLIFAERNEEHIAVDGVTPEEVRELGEANPLIERGREGKLLVWGRSSSGRHLLAVLVSRRRGAFYVVTAREMNPRKRARYNRWGRR